MIDLKKKSENDRCFLSKDSDPWLWYKRIAHINMDHLNRLILNDLVVGLPKLKFEKDKLCDACQKGKQTRTSFKSKNDWNLLEVMIFQKESEHTWKYTSVGPNFTSLKYSIMWFVLSISWLIVNTEVKKKVACIGDEIDHQLISASLKKQNSSKDRQGYLLLNIFFMTVSFGFF